MTFRLIMGRNCITEVLKAAPERLVEVYTYQTDELYHQLKACKIPIKKRSKKELSEMVSSDSHQSYVAAIKETNRPVIKEFLNAPREKSLVLMLDSIFDPQNFGTLLRAAECFGVDLVIYSKNRGTDITPVVSKTSVGASELAPISKVSNLAETARTFQKAGYWVLAAAIGEKAQNLYDVQFPEKTLLIVGSEGAGIQPLLLKLCDVLITIPMCGQIDSLNVSQATAILLNAYRAQDR